MAPRTAARTSPFALLVALALLAGCAEDGDGGKASPSASPSATPSPTVAGVRELVQKALAGGPYSAQATLETRIDGGVSESMQGRVNLNAPLTGKLRRTSYDGEEQPVQVDIVMTGKEIWFRTVHDSGPWKRRTASQAGMDDSLGSYTPYAQALLDLGDEAVKGRELTESGAQAVRLSGRLTADAVRAIDPGNHDTMRTLGVDAFDCDVWLDDSGRVVKVEQLWRPKEAEVRHTALFGDFAPFFVQRAPKAKNT